MELVLQLLYFSRRKHLLERIGPSRIEHLTETFSNAKEKINLRRAHWILDLLKCDSVTFNQGAFKKSPSTLHFCSLKAICPRYGNSAWTLVYAADLPGGKHVTPHATVQRGMPCKGCQLWLKLFLDVCSQDDIMPFSQGYCVRNSRAAFTSFLEIEAVSWRHHACNGGLAPWTQDTECVPLYWIQSLYNAQLIGIWGAIQGQENWYLGPQETLKVPFSAKGLWQLKQSRPQNCGGPDCEKAMEEF